MFKRVAGATSLCLMLACGVVAAIAPTTTSLQSSSYRFDEATIGAGGLVQSSSTNFQASSSTGDVAVGNAASSNFQVNAGSQTTADPRLAVEILSTSANFGSFSATAAATATASFSVLNYTAYGYVVQIAGTTPANGGHTIPALTTGTASQAGTEQFGLNLVANTSPASVGANPNNGQFGFGEASSNYNTSNEFRFVSGDTIALAPKSSGVTIYTMSYLVNVGSLTPGGIYKSDQSIIVTGTY